MRCCEGCVWDCAMCGGAWNELDCAGRLKWLPFGVEPKYQSLREELVQNEETTLNEADWDRMEVECAQKIKSEQFADYELEEMMALKIYSDYTADSASVRKAHWTSM